MTRKCELCGKPFEAQRARYCSSTCRANKSRGAQPAGPPTIATDLSRPASGLVDAVRAELEAAERLNSVAGQHALEIASRIVSAPGMNTGVAALSKQLQSVLADALQNSTAVADPLDELQAARERKLKLAAG